MIEYTNDILNPKLATLVETTIPEIGNVQVVQVVRRLAEKESWRRFNDLDQLIKIEAEEEWVRTLRAATEANDAGSNTQPLGLSGP